MIPQFYNFNFPKHEITNLKMYVIQYESGNVGVRDTKANTRRVERQPARGVMVGLQIQKLSPQKRLTLPHKSS